MNTDKAYFILQHAKQLANNIAEVIEDYFPEDGQALLTAENIEIIEKALAITKADFIG